jgi:hypothetical protein
MATATLPAMPGDLYSERTGQPRQLDEQGFMELVWQEIVRLREASLFGNDIAGRQGLGVPDEDSPVSEANLIRAFNVTGLRGTLMSDGLPPGWVGSNTALFFDVVEYLYRETTAEDQREFVRASLSPDLARHNPPMELTVGGQIVECAPDELRPLLEDPLPEDVTLPIRRPFEAAIEQYRRRGATEDDKRSALKHLADVLEPMKGEIDTYLLSADESALFQIANKFYIRHNTREQQRKYDGEVWLDWMFYVYVATARAMIAVMDRDELRDRVMGEPPDGNGGLPL